MKTGRYDLCLQGEGITGRRRCKRKRRRRRKKKRKRRRRRTGVRYDARPL